MCGVFMFVSNNKSLLKAVEERAEKVIETIHQRGPDRSKVATGEDYVAVHTLLSITGELAVQPVQTSDFTLAFNGEIYTDWQSYHSEYGDRDYLAELVKQKGREAFRALDGEYAIVCLHHHERKLSIVTDPFGTKPLYYLLGPDWCAVGTYPSTIAAAGLIGEPRQVASNTRIEIDVVTNRLTSSETGLWPFAFNRAFKNSYDDWGAAFNLAVAKRAQRAQRPLFVSLSAGHDSGLIAAELMSANIPFGVYSAPYLEDSDVLGLRLEILKRAGIPLELVEPSTEEFDKMQALLRDHTEKYLVENTETGFNNFADPDFRNIPGYVVSAMIHRRAREDGRLIGLSGQGADEIIADYFKPPHNPSMSDLKGDWTKATAPWANFSSGWNRAFLGASERVAGLFGIETRYPFLDTGVVQAFLDLSPVAKGRSYKAPIEARLKELGFPISSRKQGFAGFAVTQ